jgi:predicted amidohydrolase
VLHGRHRFVDPSGQSSDCEGVSAERIRAAYDNAESVPDGPQVLAIAERAKDLGVYVIYGLNELGTSAGVIYNTMVLTGPDGLSVPTEKSV